MTEYQLPLPPLPGGGADFSIDDQFRGATAAQDRVIDSLHKEGWTLHRIFTEPLAVLPLPREKFPAGRIYLFSETVAVVAKQGSGSVVTSLPAHAALQTLDQYTPEVLEADEWASRRWKEICEEEGEPENYDRHHRQTFYDRTGTRWKIRRIDDAHGLRAEVAPDGGDSTDVYSADEAEAAGMHPAVVELVDYVLEEG